MKLYVINLDRSRQRFQNITSLFDNQGLKLERIAAVDASSMSDETYRKAAQLGQWRSPMTKGAIACFLSHRLVWQKIAKSDQPYAAIFEDDATLSPSAHQFLSSWHWVPADADIVKLETRKNKVRLGKAQKLSHSRRIARLKSTHLLSAGYIISRNAAALLLQESEKVIIPVDHFMFNFGYETAQKLKLYQLDPAIVIQADFPTTILRPDNKQQVRFRQKFKREIKRTGWDMIQRFYGMARFITAQERWKRVPWA